MKKQTLLLTVLLFCIYSCGKREPSNAISEPTNEYDQYFNNASDTATQYKNVETEEEEPAKPTNIETYSQLKVNQGLTIECESTIEFVDGKTDNIIIKMQIPHESPNTINLRNPVNIVEKSPEVTSKIYTDNTGEKVIVLWRKDMTKISLINDDSTLMFLR